MAYQFTISKQLHERSSRVIPGGVNSGIRGLEKPVPLFFEKGSGCRLWDVDDNEYIDFQTGQGALLFGHAPMGLADALAAQARLGTHWAAQCRLEIDVAERLCSMIPGGEYVRFNSSATEVVNSVFRMARAQTGRSLILKFEGHYHGWGDEGLVGFGSQPGNWGPDECPASTHPSGGIIPEVPSHFVVARWNDPAHLRKRVDEFRGQIAAIIFEPVLCNTCCIEPVPGLLETIRELCDRDGMMMIADETITGFRLGGSGAMGYYGQVADMTILGKAIGGGVPIAAMVGKKSSFASVMDGRAVHAGTLNANPLCLAASRWCLEQIEALGDKHPGELMKGGQRLMNEISGIARRHGLRLHPQGPGQVFHTVLLKEGAREGAIVDHRDYVQRHDAARWGHLRLCLLQEGIRAIERGLWFVGLTHTAKDIDEAVSRMEPAFERHMREYSAA